VLWSLQTAEFDLLPHVRGRREEHILYWARGYRLSDVVINSRFATKTSGRDCRLLRGLTVTKMQAEFEAERSRIATTLTSQV
jgi:hypothetical protein